MRSNVNEPLVLPEPVPSDFSRPFWEATKQHVLLLQYDPDAGRYQFFPRPASIFTGRRNLEWRAAAGTGRPARVMLPESLAVRPRQQRSVVVLPAPLGPSRP